VYHCGSCDYDICKSCAPAADKKDVKKKVEEKKLTLEEELKMK